MLTLYHTYSSTCSKRCRIALAEKEIEWQSHHVNLAQFENIEPWYVKINSGGLVPTLDHDGRVIIESNIIMEYLDDEFPDPALAPTDNYDRAKMRRFMGDFEIIVHRNINVISHNRRFLPRFSKLTEAQQQDLLARYPDPVKRQTTIKRLADGVSEDDEAFATDRIGEVLDRMEAALGDGGPWLLGGQFTLADISIAPFIERFEFNQVAALVDWDKRPRTGEWWAAMRQRPGYQTGMNFANPDD